VYGNESFSLDVLESLYNQRTSFPLQLALAKENRSLMQESRLSTRTRLKMIGSLASLCLTSSHRKTASAEPVDTPPNIVVIVTDDMRDSDLGVLERTSELVAASGTTFPNFFLTTPQCSPSRASILTGLYAHNHGVRQNGFPLGGWDVFNENGLEDRTIAVALSDAGYHTVFAGKYLNGFPRRWERSSRLG
jgi:hypothetical protein